MTKKYFVELVNYNNWADKISMEWLNQINDEQWERTIESSHNSIKATVNHIVTAKQIWLNFWTKVPNPTDLPFEFKGTKTELIEIWQNKSANLKNFIENFPEEEYEKPVKLFFPNGGEAEMIFWQTVPHFVNHATFHRGQLVTLLRQAGFTNFSNTDLGTYFFIAK